MLFRAQPKWCHVLTVGKWTLWALSLNWSSINIYSGRLWRSPCLPTSTCLPWSSGSHQASRLLKSHRFFSDLNTSMKKTRIQYYLSQLPSTWLDLVELLYFKLIQRKLLLLILLRRLGRLLPFYSGFFSARNEWNVPFKFFLKSLTLLPFVTFYVIFFQTDFTTFKIEAMRELTLGANLPLSELNRLPWRYIPGKYKWKL